MQLYSKNGFTQTERCGTIKAQKGGEKVRPKVYENGRLRYRTLNLRLTEAERKFIFDAAKKLKVPASSLVRTATIKCCEEIKGEQLKEK